MAGAESKQSLHIDEILSIPHLGARGFDQLQVRHVTGVSTDSRKVTAGSLFIALRGERFDGHAYVTDVEQKGVIAAVVDRAGAESLRTRLPLLVVEDTTAALGNLATVYRRKFRIPVIGVAGSNGKTTTKDMIAAVLGTKLSVVRTEGNLNNHIGVPLTLFRIGSEHNVAVVEMGTNHPGELRRLCEIARPTMGIVTNVGREHLEFFNTLDGVEEEEGTLFEALCGVRGATAFVNADDPRVKRRVPRGVKTVTFGFSPRAAVRGTIGLDGTVLTVKTPAAKSPTLVRMPIPGEHIARNALAAAAVGVTFRIPAARIKAALEGFRASEKRMEVVACTGVTILNDSYNANPDSMLAALRTLASLPAEGKRIAVLGDMLELGEHAPEEHASVGREASSLGLDYVLTFGALGGLIHAAVSGPTALHYSQKNMLAEYLSELVAPGDVVLVKGSRGMKLEDVVTFLIERLRSPVS